MAGVELGAWVVVAMRQSRLERMGLVVIRTRKNRVEAEAETMQGRHLKYCLGTLMV